MTSLYTRLAGQWDNLFPPDNDRVAYIAGILGNNPAGKKVIEVGCGTGATARSLADIGCVVEASDLDPQMVAEAVKHLRSSKQGNVVFSVDDMLGALEKAKTSSTQLILCLGNTLPHLTGNDEIPRFFSFASEALARGGTLMVQLLNYPLIIRKGSLDLPELAGEDLRFRRRQVYIPESGLVEFLTEVESRGEVAKMTHKLRPLDIDSLTASAELSGLKSVGAFRDWKGSIFNGEAPWLVSLWRKEGRG